MNFSIPYGKQSITDEDIQAVVETLKSDFLTQGPKVAKFWMVESLDQMVNHIKNKSPL